MMSLRNLSLPKQRAESEKTAALIVERPLLCLGVCSPNSEIFRPEVLK